MYTCSKMISELFKIGIYDLLCFETCIIFYILLFALHRTNNLLYQKNLKPKMYLNKLTYMFVIGYLTLKTRLPR